jgi:23S rRNA pseudouridine1911/1915/1917 synthase
MNQGWIYREQIKRSAAGLTVLDYYTQQYRHSSRDDWQSRITAGQVLLDQQQTTPETVLRSGQWLAYHRPPWQEPDVPLTFEVRYEDEDLLVVVKPSGLPVLPGAGFLEHTLLGQLQRCYPRDTPTPIHRLGRGTSGLMVLARSPLAKSHLTQQMRDRQIHKVYHAWVGAGEIPNQFTITQPIGKIPHPVLGYVYGAAFNGLDAYSQVRVLKREDDRTLLEVTILTGRPHQIRIHLAFAGFPLLGDPLYGIGGIPLLEPIHNAKKLAVPGDCGYFLHAYSLTFIHPKTVALKHFTCPPP